MKIKLSNKEVTMREPKVRDMMILDEIEGEGHKELALIANLCQLPPEDVMDLTMKDYKNLQKAAQSFLEV